MTEEKISKQVVTVQQLSIVLSNIEFWVQMVKDTLEAAPTNLTFEVDQKSLEKVMRISQVRRAC